MSSAGLESSAICAATRDGYSNCDPACYCYLVIMADGSHEIYCKECIENNKWDVGTSFFVIGDEVPRDAFEIKTTKCGPSVL